MILEYSKCKVNAGTTYDREGQWVIAKYLNEYWIMGKVLESRVKYGGRIGHTIESDAPTIICLNTSEEIRPIGTHFLIEEQDIVIATEGEPVES
jgi:hypothetical protein